MRLNSCRKEEKALAGRRAQEWQGLACHFPDSHIRKQICLFSLFFLNFLNINKNFFGSLPPEQQFPHYGQNVADSFSCYLFFDTWLRVDQ